MTFFSFKCCIYVALCYSCIQQRAELGQYFREKRKQHKCWSKFLSKRYHFFSFFIDLKNSVIKSVFIISLKYLCENFVYFLYFSESFILKWNILFVRREHKNCSSNNRIVYVWMTTLVLVFHIPVQHQSG